MKVKKLFVAVALFAFVMQVSARTFSVTGGGVGEVGVGDTLVVPAADSASGRGDVVIQIETQTALLVKAGSLVILGGDERSLDVILEDGQVFIDRSQNARREIENLRVIAQGYAFAPVGTAFAVKATPQGAPTLAVLRGSARMTNLTNDASVDITVGEFATVNSNGHIVSGELSARGLAQLETWTGVKADYPPTEEEIAAREAAAAAARELEEAAAREEAARLAQSALEDDAHFGIDEEPRRSRRRPPRERAPREPTPIFARPEFEISAAWTTVNNNEMTAADNSNDNNKWYENKWLRFTLGADIPIWRFGVFLDLEFFLDNDYKFSDKGWDFSEGNAFESVLRKFRYIRYGHETDPLFVKLGGLSNVTLGYGIAMDRFTNMLHYPEHKLLGLQFYLNEITDYGLSLQTVISDFAETRDDGGIFAVRAAARPFMMYDYPALDRISVGATYAHDRNTLAPARRWSVVNDTDSNITNSNTPDSAIVNAESRLRDSTQSFAIYGFDIAYHLVATDLVNLTLYAQSAFRADGIHGWGIGAPGIWFKVLWLYGNFEYRYADGRFTHGFFDTYYLDERLSRTTRFDKSHSLDNVELSGVFGRVGMNLLGLLYLEGSYKYMFGVNDRDVSHQRYEGRVGIDSLVTSIIPRINLAEVYIRNINVGRKDNVRFGSDNNIVMNDDGDPELARLFDRTPFMYWGYRAGIDIGAGLSLIFDYRHGWREESLSSNDDNGIRNRRIVSDDRMLLQMAWRF